MTDAYPPELEALIDCHRSGEYKGRPMVDAVAGDIAILTMMGDDVVYKSVGSFLSDPYASHRYGRMDYRTLMCFIGKTAVSSVDTCPVEG